MSKNLKIAACYIRVSTDDQLEYSPDSQLAAIQRYAKQNNYILPNEFIFVEHDGISGRKAEKRPAFQLMIGTAKLKPPPFEAILVWKFSRFARNREDSIVYKSLLKKQGIEVVSISEPIGDDKMSVIFEALIEAMDEYYSINLAEEVRRGMTERAKRGKPMTIAPFGYIIKDGDLIIDEPKAEIIREVYQKFLNGAGMRAIALWLNSIGIKTKRGNVMENRTIEYWLNNPVYRGFIRWTPTGRAHRDYHNPDTMIVQGEHEPIISEEVWTATQEKLAALKEKHSKYKHDTGSERFILSGIVKCAICGRTLGKSTQIYMQCMGYGRGQCTSSQSCRIDDILEKLKISIEDDIKTGDFRIAEKIPVKSNNNIIINQISREHQKLSRAKQAYLDGIDTAEEYKVNKQSIQAEIDRLSAELEKTTAPAFTPTERKEKCTNVLSLLDSAASTSIKNAALKEIIEKAVYNKEEQSLIIFYH